MTSYLLILHDGSQVEAIKKMNYSLQIMVRLTNYWMQEVLLISIT